MGEVEGRAVTFTMKTRKMLRQRGHLGKKKRFMCVLACMCNEHFTCPAARKPRIWVPNLLELELVGELSDL